MGMPCCFGSRGQLDISNEGESLRGETVSLWALNEFNSIKPL